MKPVAVCAGTRPEVVKLAPVVRALRNRGIDVAIVTSGQHREMLVQALTAFALEPDVDLGLMEPDQSLAALTGRAVPALADAFAALAPAAVLVQGDTTTALCGALAAFYDGIPVGHVEAGLRTGDLRRPFPEEANRRLIAPLARWHFCPTPRARTNLLAEGVAPGTIEVTGNTVVDALLWTARKLESRPRSGPRRTVLVTLHRRETHGARQREIARAIGTLADRDDVEVVFPVHLSPAVRRAVMPELERHPHVTLCEPLGYEQFVAVLAGADLVLTDSGGVQEEAPTFDVPVLVMRDVTERPEGVEAGCALLCGTDPDAILAAARRVLDDSALHARMAGAPNPYGDGRAAARISDRLLADLAAAPG